MDYDPRSEPHGLAHDPGTCLVVPRPIGWITTIGPAGVVNLAPYSFFNIISTRPPFVMFSSSTRKHSQRNAETAGEFVFNLATYELRSEMNITGSDHPEDISEADIAGLAMVPSRVVKPPRVERSPIALECIYNKTIDLVCSNGRKTVNSLVIGRGGQRPHRRFRDRRRQYRHGAHPTHRPPRLYGLHVGRQYFHHAPGAGAVGSL